MSDRAGIIVAHGDLGAGLLSALDKVAGPQPNLWTLSNDGLDRNGIEREVVAIIERECPDSEVFLLTDLDGGSCCQASRALLANDRVEAVFFGINLPLLIEFVFLQDLPLDEFKEALLSKSRGALGVHG